MLQWGDGMHIILNIPHKYPFPAGFPIFNSPLTVDTDLPLTHPTRTLPTKAPFDKNMCFLK